MTVLARVIDAKYWVDIKPDSEPENFPVYPLRDLTDIKGVSFWEIDSVDSEELERVVAAIFATNPESKTDFISYDFRFARPAVVHDLGIEIKNTAGKSIDQEFGSRHRDLTIDTFGKAIGLAREMLVETNKRIPSSAVQKCFTKALQANYFSLDKFNKLFPALVKYNILSVPAVIN